jgi:hypothetical protein
MSHLLVVHRQPTPTSMFTATPSATPAGGVTEANNAIARDVDMKGRPDLPVISTVAPPARTWTVRALQLINSDAGPATVREATCEK